MEKSRSFLKKEQHLMMLFAPVLLVAIITGFVVFYLKAHTVWLQWTVLLHIVTGVLLSVLLIPYMVTHIKRILGIRRPIVFLSGVIATIVLVGLAATGLNIAFVGQEQANRWVFDWHIWFSFVFTVTLLLHVVVHSFGIYRNKRNQQIIFQSIPATTQYFSLVSIVAAGVFILLATTLYSWLYKGYVDQAVTQNYEYTYGPHPFHPSQTETENQDFVDVKRIAGSFDCASCHQQITQQWMASIHSQAASDISYVKNIKLLEKKKGIAATRYCEGCHAPVALLTGQLTSGGKHGGIKGTTAFKEGVSCMGCHGIKEVVHLKGVASYRFAPPEGYLFSGNSNWFATKIHNYLINLHPQQHKKDMARDILASPKLCATCHVQFMDKEVNNWGWVKMQDEYSAWLASSFSSQTEQSFAHEKVQRCQDCHMPLVSGNDPSADNSGKIVSHRTLAANTAIPWINGDTEQFIQTQEFLRAGKIKVTIDQPRKTDATQSDFFVEKAIRSNIDTPSFLYLGDQVTINVIVTNALVGHNFPGGSTDINEVWIAFRIADAQNKVVFVSGLLDGEGFVDTQAHFYRSLPVDRFGKHVWRHDLFNMVGNIYKNSIPSGKSDIVPYAFTVPYWAQSPLTISAVVRYRKFNKRYSQWVFGDKKINLPITDVASDVITVPLRYQIPVRVLN